MKTITVNNCTMGELYEDDIYILKQFVHRNPKLSIDTHLGYILICITLSMAFNSYRKSLPIWSLIKQVKYYYLSKWAFLKRAYKVDDILEFNDAYNKFLTPDLVKKK